MEDFTKLLGREPNERERSMIVVMNKYKDFIATKDDEGNLKFIKVDEKQK